MLKDKKKYVHILLKIEAMNEIKKKSIKIKGILNDKSIRVITISVHVVDTFLLQYIS